MFYEAVKISLANLYAYKGRSALTILGMVIGITAVIVIFSTGAGLKAMVLQQIEIFGSDTIQVEVKTPAVSKTSVSNVTSMAMGATITTLKLSDMQAVKELPNVADAYAGLMSQELVSYQNEAHSSIIWAVSASAQKIDKIRTTEGRFFTEDEDRGLARVAVLGSEIKHKLFGESDALGKFVKIGRVNYKVIGILEPRGSAFFLSMDDLVYLPVQTAQKLLMGVDYIVHFMVQIKDGDLVDQTVAQIYEVMRERHKTYTPDKEDFHATSMVEAMDMMDAVFNYLTFLLVALAAISLLVGGVGIMNVMFVSVRERTYEIGLRKAVGATYKNILWQFLVETVIIAFVAGVIGIVLGSSISFFASVAANSQGFDWPFLLPLGAVSTAVIFSVIFGMIFGILPARMAAKLDPIQALRYE